MLQTGPRVSTHCLRRERPTGLLQHKAILRVAGQDVVLSRARVDAMAMGPGLDGEHRRSCGLHARRPHGRMYSIRSSDEEMTA